MHIKVACPGCSKRHRVLAEYAGNRVKCPNCETRFSIGPISKVSAEPPVNSPPLSETPPPEPQPSIITGQPEDSRPKKRRISTVIAFVMLGITILLPVVVIGLAVSMSVSEAASRNSSSGSSDFYGGSIVATENGTFEYKTNSQKKAESAGAMLGIIIASICFPGVPYIMAMMILAASYFAFRSAGN